MRVYVARCPLVRRMPLRRFFLNTRIFGPRDSPATVPTMRAPETKGAPTWTSPEHLLDGDFLARLDVDAVDSDGLALGDLHLAAAALNDGKHGGGSCVLHTGPAGRVRQRQRV